LIKIGILGLVEQRIHEGGSLGRRGGDLASFSHGILFPARSHATTTHKASATFV